MMTDPMQHPTTPADDLTHASAVWSDLAAFQRKEVYVCLRAITSRLSDEGAIDLAAAFASALNVLAAASTP